MRFSERTGIRNVKNTIQIDYIDLELKNGLWNIFFIFYVKPMNSEDCLSVGASNFKSFIEKIWVSFYKGTLDTIPYYKDKVITILRDNYFKSPWYDVYDFIEFVCKNSNPVSSVMLTDSFNTILKKELSGFRFIGNELTPITDENQINEIQKSIENTNNLKLQGVNIHLQTALEKLSDKKNPDYRNSIKESISAIEALAQIISGDNKAELGKALKIIKEKLGLHGALEQGFIKLYGYTSDGDGIRHALLEESNLDLEDAIYMLISCSAFVNYLIIKANKVGIEFQ